MPSSDVYNVVEIAKLYSVFAGFMTGFALTIVVLLVERLANRPPGAKYDVVVGNASISIYISTFFVTGITSYLFAYMSGERYGDSVRAYLTMLCPSFVFALSTVLHMLGLTLLLSAYRLTHVMSLAKLVLYSSVILVLLPYSYTTADAASGENPVLLTDILLTFALALAFPFIFFFVRMYLLKKNGNPPFLSQGFNKFTYLCVSLAILVSVLTPFVSDMNKDTLAPSWLLNISVIILSVTVGWATLYMPNTGVGKE